MAHFAKLNSNNEVLDVVVVGNTCVNNLEFPESEPLGIYFCQSLFGKNTIWKQTSYNANFRGKYAYIGGTYDPALDVFLDPQPYPSWVLDSNYNWVAPVPYPDDGEKYFWDENKLEWVLAT